MSGCAQSVGSHILSVILRPKGGLGFFWLHAALRTFVSWPKDYETTHIFVVQLGLYYEHKHHLFVGPSHQNYPELYLKDLKKKSLNINKSENCFSFCRISLFKICHSIYILLIELSLLTINAIFKQGHSIAIGGLGAWAPSAPLRPPMKWHFAQRSMESRHFESRSPPAPLLSPYFEKSGYAPVFI